MKKNSRFLVTLSISACLAISAMAENTQLDDVNITDSAFDAQVSSISAKQLEEEQASDIKDILKSLPSVSVAGNVRYSQKVFVRGLEDKFANITIDGAKMSGQMFHHAGDQSIDASVLKISSVELGPNSALSGPGVVNGSFQYETKDPSDFLEKDENFGGKVSLGYETARERTKGTVAVFGKINEKIEFVGMGTITDDGTLHLGDGSKEANKESKLESGLAKLVFKPNEYNTLKLSYNKYKDGGNRNISGEKVGSETNEEDYSSLSRDTITFKYEYKPNNEYIDLSANVYTNKQYMEREASEGTRTDRNDANLSTTTQAPEREYINSSKGYDIRNSSLLGDHKLTYGTDYNHEEQEIKASALQTAVTTDSTDGSTTNSSKDLNIQGGEVNNYGLYIQDEMIFDKLTLTLGARYDKYELGGIYDGSFNSLQPKLKVKYQLTDNLSLRTAYGKIFKGPALGETLMLDSTDTQVADTSPQTGKNIEVGFDYNLSDALGADDAIIGFNAYKYNVDDYAHTAKNNSLAAQGEMDIWGLETMFSYNKDKLGLNASHTYTDGEQTNTAGVKYDPTTAKIHVFKVGVNYQLTEELKANYNSQLVPGNKYLSNGRSGLATTNRAGYAVHDLNFTYKPSSIKNATFNFGVGNIFDKAYVRHTAFGSSATSTNKAYETGRNFKFQISYRF